MTQEPTWWITGIYFFSSLIALVLDGCQRTSKWLIHLLLWINFLSAAGIFLVTIRFQKFFVSHNPLGQSRIELFSILLLVALFSLTVEIPGFLLNSLYDRTTISILDDVISAVLDLRLDPSIGVESLEALLHAHKHELRRLGAGYTLEKMADSFRRMRNIDTPLLEATLFEVRTARAAVDARSKHPLPTLIQFFGLSGLAFVLGEILATLRGK